MRTITVNASQKYQVFIGSDLIPQLGELMKELQLTGKAAIISDTNVWPLYGERVRESLCSAGFETTSFIFHAGEESKNTTTYLQILTFLSEHQFTRTDTLVALGGGVVGDITGFAAATFLRGVDFV